MSLPEVRTLEYVCPHCGGSTWNARSARTMPALPAISPWNARAAPKCFTCRRRNGGNERPRDHAARACRQQIG